MKQQTITNFYVHWVSKRIFATLWEISKCCDSEYEKESKQAKEFEFRCSIQNYWFLKAELTISKVNHVSWNFRYDKRGYFKYAEERLISSFIIEKHSNFEIYEGDCEWGDDIEAFTKNKNKIVDAIFLWKHSKCSIKFIATKLSIQKKMICNILSKYKENIKKRNMKEWRAPKAQEDQSIEINSSQSKIIEFIQKGDKLGLKI